MNSLHKPCFSGKHILLLLALTSHLAGQDFDAHVKALKKRLPHAGFSIVVQKPFVVVGDESAFDVNRRAKRTVKWAVDLEQCEQRQDLGLHQLAPTGSEAGAEGRDPPDVQEAVRHDHCTVLR